MAPKTHQTISVYPATAFRAIEGVAEGDAISFADELVMDDVYGLDAEASRAFLSLTMNTENDRITVAEGSALGHAGSDIVLDCCLTLMAPDSTTYEALVMVEVENNEAAAVYFLPLATLDPNISYRLVGADKNAGASRFAEVACVAFTRGTHITLASGEQRMIEDLTIGDRVLTRDDGPKKIRWIGAMTIRAVGEFAPVMIRKGVLNNENDLVVSPDHRLFIYQRRDRLGAGRAEVLIKARHLIDGEDVIQQDGGFVDYFQLLFDQHHFIYAEGIAAESVLIDPRTRAAIPSEATTEHKTRAHQAYEVQETLATQPGAASLLKKASSASD